MLGAAALQLEVLVELLEHRLDLHVHSPTVAETGARRRVTRRARVEPHRDRTEIAASRGSGSRRSPQRSSVRCARLASVPISTSIDALRPGPTPVEHPGLRVGALPAPGRALEVRADRHLRLECGHRVLLRTRRLPDLDAVGMARDRRPRRQGQVDHRRDDLPLRSGCGWRCFARPRIAGRTPGR